MPIIRASRLAATRCVGVGTPMSIEDCNCSARSLSWDWCPVSERHNRINLLTTSPRGSKQVYLNGGPSRRSSVFQSRSRFRGAVFCDTRKLADLEFAQKPFQSLRLPHLQSLEIPDLLGDGWNLVAIHVWVQGLLETSLHLCVSIVEVILFSLSFCSWWYVKAWPISTSTLQISSLEAFPWIFHCSLLSNKYQHLMQ